MEIGRLRLFLEVVQRGSFAAVAREHNVAPSSISRAIAALEAELGVRLLQRSTRKLVPTEAGSTFFHRMEGLVEEFEQARLAAMDAESEPTGVLRVTAPASFAQLNLVPLLPEFAKRYPSLSMELMLSDRFLDLYEDRIDVAIRLGKLEDSSLIATRLCDMPYVLCASPSYLDKAGTPCQPEDLKQHQCLRYPIAGIGSRWLFRKEEKEVEIPIQGKFLISNGLALRDCALQGLGIVLLPRWLVQDSLEQHALVPLLTDWEATASQFGIAVWMLTPSRTYLPRKVRAWMNFLKKSFQQKIQHNKSDTVHRK